MTVRYKKSVEPYETDGRDIDTQVAELIGEAASQEASGASDKHIREIAQTWQKWPEPQASDPTYYDRPLLNEPVWEWAIPTYYYVGGLAGASLVLGAAAQLKKSRKLEKLIRRCHWIGLIGAVISGGLLVYDLGRPSRFMNMLRVFRPTSPMNMGAWILSGAGGAATLTVLLRGQGGLFGTLGDAAGLGAGVFGLGLASYTGVLVSSSAVPIWQESRSLMPVVFAASAMSSVGSAFEMFVQDPEERRLAKAFGTVGQVAELVASIAMERRISVVPRVALPFKRGFSGLLWRSAALLSAASVVIGVLPNRSRAKRVTAGVLGTAGCLLLRVAVEHAGKVSARDARASFHQQRNVPFRG